MKRQLIAHIAQKLASFGYTVYIAQSGTYGFYTDGAHVVSFGGPWGVSFSGTYRALTDEGGRSVGSGWLMEDGKELSDITEEQARTFITANAPWWATRGIPVIMTTPEQHLKTYGPSSRYALYSAPQT